MKLSARINNGCRAGKLPSPIGVVGGEINLNRNCVRLNDFKKLNKRFQSRHTKF
jgi:hypothetical protein